MCYLIQVDKFFSNPVIICCYQTCTIWWEISIFDIKYVRLTCFDIKFVSLSKYDTEYANFFETGDFSFFLFHGFYVCFSFTGHMNYPFCPSPNQNRLNPIDPVWVECSSRPQGLRYRPVRPNQRDAVPVYRTGLAGNRSKPVEVKFEFKIRCVNGSYRYTGRLDRFTGRFDW